MNTKYICLFLIVSNLSIFGQYNGNDFSIGFYGIYTTSGSIFLNPNASDVVLRGESFVIDDIFNPGFEVRYRISEPLIFGLNVEYIKTTNAAPNFNIFYSGSVHTLNVKDGFKLIPFELTAYYLLPFSTEDFKFLMGGGIAYYNGEFLRKIDEVDYIEGGGIRKIGEVNVKNVDKETAFGIQVSISMDYILTNFLSVNFQMKFRDPEFTVSSKYDKSALRYLGNNIPLPKESFDTKINVDGVTFVLGTSLQF